MSSSIPGSLPKADQDAVRKLLKSLHATKYDDPVDQDAFLLDSANTLLRFRPYLASFAMASELGECVFTLRSLMHVNNVRLGTPPSDAFLSLQDFVGDIIRKRQVFRERQRANADRARIAGGIAAQIVHSAALEYASHVNKKAPGSPDDTVSIPSSSDESGMDGPPRTPTSPPPSLVTVESSPTQDSQQVCFKAILLSPIGELGVHLAAPVIVAEPVHLAKPIPTGPRAGLHSQPTPDPRKRRRIEDGEISDSQAGSSLFHPHPSLLNFIFKRNFHPPGPVVQCHSVQLVPRPIGPLVQYPKPNYVDDWLLSRRRSADFPSRRRNYSGGSKPSVNQNHAVRRPPIRKYVLFYFALFLL
ncbi:hypothetical protein B0H17DRAFT_1147538 [Mycena rosella]|uniref:Uncharacterized protein n=1 Tax=Mycena rosella TaxID=1033263 RepID=A0AAD7FZN9_MYCRO|nr:hypothetical protein B0H17DRAFT_1147538 [Mycena rosella]